MKIRALVDYTQKADIPAWLKWRITLPYAMLRRYNINANIAWYGLELPDEDVDILVIPRLIVAKWERSQTLEWINKLKERGICLVFESDDDIWSESYATHIAQTSLQAKENTPIEVVRAVFEEMDARRDAALWMINQCDAVTVSTPILAKYVQTLVANNIKVYIIPNAIDTDVFERGLRVFDNIESIGSTVGWFGGRRAISELEFMLDAWRMVATFDTNIKFKVSSWLYETTQTFDALKDRVESIPWDLYENYSKNLQVDIGCCAVDDSDFCARKTPIKAWEYALAGALPIGTKNLYGTELGIGLTTDDVIEYASLIAYYARIENAEDRKNLVQIYQDHTIGYHSLKYEWYRWKEVYENIYKNYNYNRKEIVNGFVIAETV